MNLSGIVSGAIGTVNPAVSVTLRVSVGYNTQPDGTRTPNYADYANLSAQVQPMSGGDLSKTAGLNLQGIKRSVYLNGNVEGLDRQAVKGGDLIQMPNLPDFPGPTTWLVAAVLEHWPDWSKVVATLQNGG